MEGAVVLGFGWWAAPFAFATPPSLLGGLLRTALEHLHWDRTSPCLIKTEYPLHTTPFQRKISWASNEPEPASNARRVQMCAVVSKLCMGTEEGRPHIGSGSGEPSRDGPSSGAVCTTDAIVAFLPFLPFLHRHE